MGDHGQYPPPQGGQAPYPYQGPQQPGQPLQMPMAGAPPPQQPQQQQTQVAHSTTADDVGQFNGGAYRISHRDTNSILTIHLAYETPITAKPGAMVSKDHDVAIKGNMKFSIRKIISGDVTFSTITGPGEVLLAPPFLGDIAVIEVRKGEEWLTGKDAVLAYTAGCHKSVKSQKLSQGIFSGEGFFVVQITGEGLMWITSFGAIMRKRLEAGEEYWVDNGHLVAWQCKYKIQQVASGGIMSNTFAGEGVACKFTGPGIVYFQTRNPQAFAATLGLAAAK